MGSMISGQPRTCKKRERETINEQTRDGFRRVVFTTRRHNIIAPDAFTTRHKKRKERAKLENLTIQK